MKIATGDQVSVAELKAKLGIEDGDIYYSILEQPLYMENKLHRVTVEMVTKDEEGELLGAVRGTDDEGNQIFMNVLYDPVTQTWRRNKLMDDMISTLEQKQGERKFEI